MNFKNLLLHFSCALVCLSAHCILLYVTFNFHYEEEDKVTED